MANQSIKNAFERMWEHTLSKIDSSAIQSNWNQNDETAKDYIKNRPFYEETGYEICNPEQTFTLSSSSNESYSSLQRDIYIDYTRIEMPTVVILDGVEYTDLDIYVSDGENVYIDFIIENGDKISILENSEILMPTSYAGTTHTIEIKQEKVSIKPIDNKYLGIQVFNGTGEKSIVLNSDINVASGKYSYAEGYETEATATGAHAEGFRAIATASGAHAEGNTTTASGVNSHAEGYETEASGIESHAEGKYTIAKGIDQHVQGRYNIEDADSIYAHIVGNGTRDERSNAHTLDWSGNAWYAGSVEVKSIILKSSTEGSSKRFELTIDDTGTLSIKELV